MSEIVMMRCAGMIILLMTVGSCKSGSPVTVKTYPYNRLWQDAIRRCIIEYPAASVAAGHQGVGVVVVDVDPPGNVETATVLEAPDALTARSLKACTAGFQAARAQAGSEAIRRGKIFAYFVITGGSGRVVVLNDPRQKAELLIQRQRPASASQK
jgi:hypothetical protein